MNKKKEQQARLRAVTTTHFEKVAAGSKREMDIVTFLPFSFFSCFEIGSLVHFYVFLLQESFIFQQLYGEVVKTGHTGLTGQLGEQIGNKNCRKIKILI